MDVGAYLERICFVGSTAPSVASLRALHRAHVLSVPFETLSIHCGEPITLDLEKIYRKIVKERRGGFCYENNGLFSWLLRQLGFQVTLCSARVLSPFTHRYGPPFQHLMILVKLVQRTARSVHRRFLQGSDSSRGSWWMLAWERHAGAAGDGEWAGERAGVWDVELQPPRAGEDECWTVLYKFTTTARGFLEFSDMCQYNQTSPSSMPASKSLCTLHTPQGRVTYMGQRLTSTTVKPARNHRVRRKSKAVRELSDEEIPIVLRDVFGVVLKNPLVPKDRAIVPEECDQF
ncbi:arylamine N-acetyltransferase, pineal gland isozyme NAT-3-like [Callorhinchus milii]|uniref:arylamine N-acetyltransferase, pineal gland isozyme NAT-3-like n=1 Tax=Callorhinchus milii TaxID=7868 RepID=UPI001C3F7A5E|nr:arylamine N-acetyltransferase, pineal gland isozyme NAT-3-like [Callorhinchus milii]